jgi:hypothetical protein
MPYRIFKRKPYKRTPRGYTPKLRARCSTIRLGEATAAEPRAICARGPANVALEEGREYRHLSFYEFIQE